MNNVIEYKDGKIYEHDGAFSVEIAGGWIDGVYDSITSAKYAVDYPTVAEEIWKEIPHYQKLSGIKISIIHWKKFAA